MPRVSVVVITRNRPSSLLKCWESLQAQTIAGFECIVVDNSTNDETRTLVEQFGNVVYRRIDAPLGSQPVLRNVSIEMARGEIIAFLDDDGFPQPSWLEELMKCYDDPIVGGAGGRIIQGAMSTSKERVGKLRILGGVEGNWNYDGKAVFEVDHLQGTNMSFKQSVLHQIKGWDEAFCGGYATFEEPDVCLRVKRLGYKIVFNSKAAVLHGEAMREGSFGRSVHTSPILAYYTGRNGTYLYLKNLGWRPRVLAAVFIGNPAIETLRCFFGSARRPDLCNFHLAGFQAAILHLVGVVRGTILALKHALT